MKFWVVYSQKNDLHEYTLTLHSPLKPAAHCTVHQSIAVKPVALYREQFGVGTPFMKAAESMYWYDFIYIGLSRGVRILSSPRLSRRIGKMYC